MRNIATSELEAMATTRLLCDRLWRNGREEFTAAELLEQSAYTVNDILKEYGVDRELWVRVRGKKAWLFFVPTNHIVAEVAVDSEKIDGYLRRRPRVLLLHRKLWMRRRQNTIADMIVEMDKLNQRHNNNERRG